MSGNQVRLYFAGLAYLLVQAVRALGLKGTELSRAQAGTIRIKLFKIAARVVVSVRRVVLHLCTSCPYQKMLARLVSRLVPT